MEFDKSRVYTAINADELKVGSKVICASCLANLKEYVADYKKELKQAIKEYKKVHWVIICEDENIEKLVENDPDGRECLWEFDEELSSWADKIISDFEFPWEEGCSMWIGAVDKDGEMVWDNQ